ncbi:DEAD/DEAH box helicase [Wenzhouxiangella sp. AB-CW3]|uniref:DEAD/DEAH box helicase n=1 Tax=Wenzhouxiangella sp. AB-CW3 TaxID=2771012 RepID=UPI00168BF2D1|nr:DEAD/DEAH box helicase [Wenzhouxiangella sp. AB-CW3]QOC21387.1 DEAD/DEAH box helicase [Wenzhouxiangella sp. AB-CW3]
MNASSALTEALLDACTPGCLASAKRLQAAGRVEPTAKEVLHGCLVVTGVVGEGDKVWRPYVTFENDRPGGDCSCQGDDICEHMAALVLALGEESPRPAIGRGGLYSTTNAESGLYKDRQYMAYLLALSEDGGELSVCPSRVAVSRDGPVVTPFSLKRLADDVQPAYVSDLDLDILHALTDHVMAQTGLSWYPLGRGSTSLLQGIVATGRCHWRAVEGPRLEMADPVAAQVRWELLSSGQQQIHWSAPGPDGGQVLPLLPPWLLDETTGTCRIMDAGIDDSLAARLLLFGPVAPDQVDTVIDLLDEAPASFPRPRRLPVRYSQDQSMVPVLHLVRAQVARSSGFEDTAAARLQFDYGELKLDWDDEYDSRLDGEGAVIRVARNRKREQQVTEQLRQFGLIPLNEITGRDHEPGEGGLWVAVDRRQVVQTWVTLQTEMKALAGSGWEVHLADDFAPELIEPDQWYGDLSEGENDTVELDLGIIWRGQRLSLLAALLAWVEHVPEAMLRQLLASRGADRPVHLWLDERRIVLVPAERIAAAMHALTEGVVDASGRGMLRVHRARLAELAATAEAWPPGQESSEDDLQCRLARLEHLEPMDPPAGFRADLRDYQRQGLGWLQFLREAGFGGVLADDMGLGKTIQALAHVVTEKAAGRLEHPCLVIAPTSLMFNWRAEARRFAPDLRLLTLHGARRHGLFGWIDRSDLVLTSYPLVLRDIDRLREQRWHLLILDEAQAIKNPRARVSREVRTLDARHRLSLTGTPLENRLEELWSQFDFLMPGFLGRQKDFRRRFALPIERDRDETRRSELAMRVRPFMLRRSKADVAPELPAKTEMTRAVVLDEDQQKLYERVRLMLHERVRQAIQARGAERSRVVVLDALLKLRQICCDPRLLRHVDGADQVGSAKMRLLMDLLPELVAEGRRILVFSQFVSMLDLIAEAVAEAGIEHVRLTGRTRNRQKVVERFQGGDVPVFLISLKAGGVGLNLTAADTVIHYDPWWNPAAEDQATDRAHRIGQGQKVFVYRLLTEDTIEQRVAEMQHSKRGLVEGLFGGQADTPLRAEVIEALLAPLEAP